MSVSFTIADLMALLSQKAGLPADRHTDRRDLLFVDLDLDSLAFLQLQGELKRRYGVELPDDRAQEYSIGDILDTVSTAEVAA
jgi:minimal PKS acyl carrier protein